MRRFWGVLTRAAVAGEIYAVLTGRETLSDYTRWAIRSPRRGDPNMRVPAILRNPRIITFWIALGWFAIHAPLDCWSAVQWAKRMRMERRG